MVRGPEGSRYRGLDSASVPERGSRYPDCPNASPRDSDFSCSSALVWRFMEKEEEEEIFTVWPADDEEDERIEDMDEEEEEQETERKASLVIPMPSQWSDKRRASLPCPAQLSAMHLTHLSHLSRLHAATMAPSPAHVRQRLEGGETRHCSRFNYVRSEEEEYECRHLHMIRPPAVPTIPEVLEPLGRKTRFRSRNVMSLSDADSTCLICHDDLRRGGRTVRELHCSHSFHSECIEKWLWMKQTCPTCRKHVAMPEPLYWTSTRVKVP